MATSEKDKIMSDKETSLENKNLEKDKNNVGDLKKDDQTILTSLEDYIKTASYLGTKVITPTMR
jgi:hypothetical protein